VKKELFLKSLFELVYTGEDKFFFFVDICFDTLKCFLKDLALMPTAGEKNTRRGRGRIMLVSCSIFLFL